MSAQVHPSALVAADVELSERCVVGPNVRIDSGCKIGH